MLESEINQLRKTKRHLSYFIDDRKRFIQHFLVNQEIVNQKEIRIIGLRRSGNHGIIIWIRRHYPERIWHLNNVSPFRNPYRQLSENYPYREKLKKEAQGIFSKKECLLYNYENCCLESIANSKCTKNHDLYLGKTKIKHDLLILRDPYNMFASIYKGQLKNNNRCNYSRTYPNNQKSITELWLQYAQEFVGETNYLKYNKVLVNYNQWVNDQNYRKIISEQLGLEFCDAGFNIVKKYGGGSSFDGTAFNNKANQMNVLNRWQEFIDDLEYRKMFNNKIREYSHRIFGDIEGTKALIT